MKIITSNFKKGFVKVTIETPEDIWVLSTIIQTNDLVHGNTTRKIKTGTEEKSVIHKKRITITLRVDEVVFIPEPSAVRITGTIVEAPEEIPRGSHHTLTLEIHDTITLEKETWLSFHIEKLREATETKTPPILLCIFDREEAFFAYLTRQGYELLAHLRGDVAKKISGHKASGNFYRTIIQKLDEYDQRFKLDKIILASPSFWKEELLKELNHPALRKKLILATCSSVDETAFTEVLKREETRTALQQQRITEEHTLIDQLLAEISKKGNTTYGLSATLQAAHAGAIRTLIITDRFITKKREEKKYADIETLLKTVENSRGTIYLIHSAYAPGKKLDGLGGIAALLRYKLE